MSEQNYDSRESCLPFDHKPNFLFICVDQQRYPVIYENEELKAWRKEYLIAQEILKSRGLEFKNQYAGSTACSPSRATFYTGQYPSLHGVSQTDGAAKTAYDPDMFWLNPNTVPTMGDYFRTAGYQTYWKGKWHASAADILVPGTHNKYPTYDPETGIPIPENERLYINADVLGDFGFKGWIGPEPHGANPRNSGSSAAIGLSGRDVVYRRNTVELIRKLDEEYTGPGEQQPWFIMCSFVNPHDIAVFGAVTRFLPNFNFRIDPSVPYISPAPTATESLSTKPVAQFSYRRIYPLALQPLEDTLFYRQLYYSLQLEVDRQICGVLDALMESTFYNNTIIIFTSDHGELLGAHGSLFQKWYQAYEETIHVPLIIHNPLLFERAEQTELLTSHVDILPTMLGISGLDAGGIQNTLSNSFTEVRPFVGRDLSPLIFGRKDFTNFDEPVYFMTDDNFTKGLDQVSFAGIPYHAVIQPNSIQTVITALPTGEGGKKEIWKYSRYFDNPQFESIGGRKEQYAYKGIVNKTFNYGCFCDSPEKVKPPDQFEMYNLSIDPLEVENLAYTSNASPKIKKVQIVLEGILQEECKKKRLYPVNGDVPGKPSCSFENYSYNG